MTKAEEWQDAARRYRGEKKEKVDVDRAVMELTKFWRSEEGEAARNLLEASGSTIVFAEYHKECAKFLKAYALTAEGPVCVTKRYFYVSGADRATETDLKIKTISFDKLVKIVNVDYISYELLGGYSGDVSKIVFWLRDNIEKIAKNAPYY
jgi:hypothetical protein